MHVDHVSELQRMMHDSAMQVREHGGAVYQETSTEVELLELTWRLNRGEGFYPAGVDVSPANAGIRKGLFLPKKMRKGEDSFKGKERPPSPSGDRGKMLHDCSSNIPTIYYYDFWRDLAATELLRRKLATRDNLSILEAHLHELEQANNASDSSNGDETLLDNDSLYDCKIEWFDSKFALVRNLALASKGKGPKNILAGYQKTRKTIVCRWLEPAELAPPNTSKKEIDVMIKERMPPAVWEILHQQRKWKGKNLIRDMSTDTRHKALREAYDEYILLYAEKHLDAQRNVLRDRALGKKASSKPISVNRWKSTLQSMNEDLIRAGSRQLKGFVSPQRSPQRVDNTHVRLDNSHQKLHVLSRGSRATSPTEAITWGRNSTQQKHISSNGWDQTGNGAGAQDRK